MLPFVAPMVLAPRLTARLARRLSGRTILTLGLASTVLGNLLFWAVACTQLTYGVFVIAMLVAGCGAGLLNGQTVKVLGGAKIHSPGLHFIPAAGTSQKEQPNRWMKKPDRVAGAELLLWSKSPRRV